MQVCAHMRVCVCVCIHIVKVLCENHPARTNAWPLSRYSLHNCTLKHMPVQNTRERKKYERKKKDSTTETGEQIETRSGGGRGSHNSLQNPT